MSPCELVATMGGRYSKEFGIDLSSRRREALFKWLLASILFGARISGKIAGKTFRCFQSLGVLSPERILDAGRDNLVALLDEGGYVRYDFGTAAKLLEAAGSVLSNYAGDLNSMHSQSADPADLENRTMALARGIGPVTANIFLRETRDIWEKARPLPSDFAILAAKHHGYIPEALEDRKEALRLLVDIWGKGEGFPDFEAALSRQGILLRRKKPRH